MNRDLIIFFTASHYWQWNDSYAVPFLVNMFVYDMFVHNSIQSNAMQCNGCRNSAATNCHAIVVDDWRIFLEYYLRLSGAEPGIVIDRLYCTLQKGSRCFCMGQKCPKNWSLPWGSWPPCNECMVPWAHASQFPKQHPDWFSHFCVQRSKTYSDYERAGQFPKIAPAPWEICTPLIHGSLSPPKSAPKRHLSWFSRFCRAYKCYQQTHRPTTLLRLLQ